MVNQTTCSDRNVPLWSIQIEGGSFLKYEIILKMKIMLRRVMSLNDAREKMLIILSILNSVKGQAVLVKLDTTFS